MLIRKKVQATGLDRPLRSSLLFVFPKSKSFFKCRASFQNCKTNFHSFIIFCCVNFSADFFFVETKDGKVHQQATYNIVKCKDTVKNTLSRTKLRFCWRSLAKLEDLKRVLKFIYKPCFRKIRKPLESLSKL